MGTAEGLQTSPPEDLRTLEALVSGQMNAQEGLLKIAHSGGWPLRTHDRLVFAAPAGSGLRLVSEHDGWKPQALQRRGAIEVIEVAKDADVGRYKFKHPDGVDRPDPWARAFGYDSHGEFSLARASGARLERWPLLTDGKTRPRTVEVWVPPQRPTHHLYMQDGQNLFNPSAMWGGWRVQEQTGANTLVIGLETAAGRFEDLTPFPESLELKEGQPQVLGGQADAYADFIKRTVMPFVEARYGAPKKVGAMGSSLGGLFSMHLAKRFPDSFDFIGSMSGTFGWGRALGQNDFIEGYAGHWQKRPIFYLDSGGEPNGGDNHDVTRELTAQMQSSGFRMGRDLFHWHEPGGLHRETAWRARLHRPLRLFERL